MAEEQGQAPDLIARWIAELVGHQVHVAVGVPGWYFFTGVGELRATDDAEIFEIISPSEIVNGINCVFNLAGVYEASAEERMILLKPRAPAVVRPADPPSSGR